MSPLSASWGIALWAVSPLLLRPFNESQAFPWSGVLKKRSASSCCRRSVHLPLKLQRQQQQRLLPAYVCAPRPARPTGSPVCRRLVVTSRLFVLFRCTISLSYMHTSKLLSLLYVSKWAKRCCVPAHAVSQCWGSFFADFCSRSPSRMSQGEQYVTIWLSDADWLCACVRAFVNFRRQLQIHLVKNRKQIAHIWQILLCESGHAQTCRTRSFNVSDALNVKYFGTVVGAHLQCTAVS